MNNSKKQNKDTSKVNLNTEDSEIIKNTLKAKTDISREEKVEDISQKKDSIKDLVSEKIFADIFAKKSNLELQIKELQKKKDSLEKDISSSFSGKSEEIAKRVKGFQDYLTGALQHLSQSVEKLELVSQPIIVKPSPLDENNLNSKNTQIESIPALSDTFKPDEDIIRKCFDNFKKQPDFYAEPWKLRRSLDNNDIEILNDWFFNMGGRGALQSRGTRQKNALVTAALISILGELYGDQFQTLILASEPERLGEWRRILQDSLGLTREDFGPNSGIVLFERPEGVIERADRLEENEEVPLIIIDASETSVEIPILQFPLWLAFAGNNDEIYNDLDLN
tara:strand:- start:24151 stop:25161 length:1011 start_codon:yes stop_codon:yes gene_type:complete